MIRAIIVKTWMDKLAFCIWFLLEGTLWYPYLMIMPLTKRTLFQKLPANQQSLIRWTGRSTLSWA